MRLSLRARVVLAMVVSGAVTVVVLLATTMASVNRVPFLERWTVPVEDLTACEADPAHWKKGIFEFGDAWAYDLEGHSRNTSAPLLERALVEKAVRDGGAVSVGGPGPDHVEVQRVAKAGPCALIRVRVGAPPPEMGSAAGLGVVLGTGFSLLLLVGLATWFVLHPLLHRIAQIRRAAEAVGSTAYIPATDEIPDALGAIAAVLDASHRRILTNETELRERQVALERHLAEIAHDLRTPLASLVLAVQDLVPLRGGPAVGRALDDAEYVNALVDNLHQGTLLRRGLSSSAAGVVDLCEIVQRLEARFAALGALRGMEVAASFPERPVLTSGAPALAERAIANLVHNAVRHGRDGGHVAVVLEREGDTFELTVADDGPGLGRDQLASLQEATFGGDGARPRSGGLGLTVTLEAARRFGWEVRFEAGEAPGLRVVVAGACRLAGLG